MKIISLLAVMFITLMNYSCKIDPEIEILGDCEELDLIDGYTVSFDSVMYYAPFFNPNNSNQFVYIERNSSDFIKWLCTYDISTQEKIYLCDGASFNPRWGKNDWIIFNRGVDIWKIKSNGDSLTNIFSGFNNYDPEINPRGDKIIFRQSNDYYTTFLIDLNGAILDSISDQYFGEASWSPDGLKISSKLFSGEPFYLGGSFGYYDTTLSIFTGIILTTSTDHEDHILDTEWLPDSKRILWSSGNEYKITDTETNQTSSFIQNCDSYSKLWPCYSNDGNKIIWERNIKESRDHGSEMFWQTQIVITDSNGANEIQIIPE